MTIGESAILLSGGRGVLGSAFFQEVAGHPAVTVTNLDADIRSAPSMQYFLSLRGPFTHLVHAAAIVETRRVDQDPGLAWETNVEGTRILIEAFWNSNPQAHVTLISSSHVYGPKNSPLPESAPLDPINFYGETKLEAENTVRNLGENHCIARLFSMYSEKQIGSFLLPSIRAKIERAGDDALIRLKGWNNVRDFSSAQMHARAVAFLSLRSHRGTVNVGSGEGKTVLDFARERMNFSLSNPDQDRVDPPSVVVADVKTILALGYTPAST